MKNKMGLVLMIFAVSFLSACASNAILVAKNPMSANNYSVNDKGTIKILDQERITDTHWMYVECDQWSGCYMMCEGKLDSCKHVLRDYKYINSRPGWQE
jgi:hypothetical protein